MAVVDVELSALWERVIEHVSIGEPQHRAFLMMTKVLGLIQSDDGTSFLVAAPNAFAKDVLESRLRIVVNEVLTRELGDKTNIAVMIDENIELADLPAPTIVVESTPAPSKTLGRDAHGSIKNEEPSQLNPRYIFETFVIGASNRFAHAAAVAVAEAPAKAYNPLFIYGDSGLGKTHLLHAIGAYAKELYGNVRVRYVSSEEFTNDFINAIANNRGPEFQSRYREIDILLIDDIQFLQGKDSTQEAFFHTFNTLHDHNKQVVVTSDLPPKQLTGFEDRMRSRFEWGLITDVQAPDLETRIAILRKKAASERIDINDDVVEYMASKVSSNIRELEGALIRVTAFANLNKTAIDMSLAQTVLKDLVLSEETNVVAPGDIISLTATFYQLSVEDLYGSSRSQTIALARQVAMYLCREMTSLSLPKIGQLFGNRDHTTVMYANKKISELMKERRSIYNQVTEITSRIKQNSSY